MPRVLSRESRWCRRSGERRTRRMSLGRTGGRLRDSSRIRRQQPTQGSQFADPAPTPQFFSRAGGGRCAASGGAPCTRGRTRRRRQAVPVQEQAALRSRVPGTSADQPLPAPRVAWTRVREIVPGQRAPCTRSPGRSLLPCFRPPAGLCGEGKEQRGRPQHPGNALHGCHPVRWFPTPHRRAPPHAPRSDSAPGSATSAGQVAAWRPATCAAAREAPHMQRGRAACRDERDAHPASPVGGAS